jgi:hypothetical protein
MFVSGMDDDSFDRDMSVACLYDGKLGWLLGKGAMAHVLICGRKHSTSNMGTNALLIVVA